MSLRALSGVIVSAGKSSRFLKSLESQKDAPQVLSKLFVEVDAKPLFVVSIEKLLQLPVEELVLVIHPEAEDDFLRELKRFGLEKKVKLVHGGARRQDSARNGLLALGACDRVFIHDGARPFLSKSFLESLFTRAREVDALIPALPVVETLKEIDAEGKVVKTHSRDKFVRVQTPQFFRYELIRRVHEELRISTQEFTDDAAMLEHLGYEVHTMTGSPENLKVTTIADLSKGNC